MKIFVETERLILREIVETDAAAMYALDSDADVHQFLGKNPIQNTEQALSNITYIRKQYQVNGIGRWAVVEKSTNSFIGWAGLKLITETTNAHINYYDLGYRLIKEYWGKGYATEAANAIVDYGFSVLNLSEIYAIADVQNIPSVHVLEKAGLKRLEVFNYENTPHYWLKIKK